MKERSVKDCDSFYVRENLIMSFNILSVYSSLSVYFVSLINRKSLGSIYWVQGIAWFAAV